MKRIEREMIEWGKLLFERRLVSGWGGNISCRAGKGRFLITGQHAPLGFLAPREIVPVDSLGRALKKVRQPSSETPLHMAVYRGTEARAVIHAHPPMVLAFSLSHGSFVPLSFEEKYTVGEVLVIAQETPTVTETEKVVEELKLRPIVILKGHGTVAVGKDLREAFLLTDLLEEAVHCRFFRDEAGEGPTAAADRAVGREIKGARPAEGYALFSRAHMSALVECANGDAEFHRRAHETDLATTLTLHLEETDGSWTVHFAGGGITALEPAGEGEFLISGKKDWWEAIFQGRMDPFLATQQGKLKLKRGELSKLSRWFKPFERAFALWQAIPIR